MRDCTVLNFCFSMFTKFSESKDIRCKEYAHNPIFWWPCDIQVWILGFTQFLCCEASFGAFAWNCVISNSLSALLLQVWGKGNRKICKERGNRKYYWKRGKKHRWDRKRSYNVKIVPILPTVWEPLYATWASSSYWGNEQPKTAGDLMICSS